MNSSCGWARRVLGPTLGPLESSDESLRAHAHVQGCGPCSSFYSEMESIASTMRQHAPRAIAPLNVREALFESIAEWRAARRGRNRKRAAVGGLLSLAAAALVILFGIDRTSPVSPQGAVLAAVTEDHRRSLRTDDIESGNAVEVSRWLNVRLPFAVETPVFPMARLEGGRVAIVGVSHAAVMRYSLGKEAVSYFVVPYEAELENPEREHIRTDSTRGYQIAMWKDGGLLHVMVGRVAEASLLQLAKLCIEQSQRAAAIMSSPGIRVVHHV